MGDPHISNDQIETTTVRLGEFEADIVTNAGPRILAYRRAHRPTPFANLGDAAIDLADGDRYEFIGGHRLWRAPEVPSVTYEPDDGAVRVDKVSGGYEVAAAPDRHGVIKRLIVTHVGEFTVVDHVIENTEKAPILVAPWAITQLAVGGTAYLPLPTEPADPHGVLPNGSLVTWPYTDLAAPELSFTERWVSVEASDRPAKLKIGLPNRGGWLAYHLGDQVFVKWSHVHREEAFYVDMGASAQCFRDDRFIELETLGSRASLSRREHVTHREVWTIMSLGSRTIEELLSALPVAPPGVIV